VTSTNWNESVARLFADRRSMINRLNQRGISKRRYDYVVWKRLYLGIRCCSLSRVKTRAGRVKTELFRPSEIHLMDGLMKLQRVCLFLVEYTHVFPIIQNEAFQSKTLFLLLCLGYICE